MKTIKDQIGRQLEFSAIPLRVVSLVPSITELLVDLEIENEILGITKFCVHPSHLKKVKSIVGGTKNVNIKKVTDLSPDLIIANKEENTKAQIDELSKLYTTFVSDIKNVKDTLELITAIGKIFNRELKANRLVQKINFQLPKSIFHNKKVLYLIWQKPFMSVGRDTYIHDIITRLGLSNCCADQKRYPKLDAEEIINLNPDYLFLSSEPYPFKEKHKEELKNIIPNSKIILVDGEAFSWYGTRILKLGDYFEQLKKNIR